MARRKPFDDAESQAAGCTGKEAFPSRRLAAQIQRRRDRSRDKEIHAGEPYKCRYCPCWHLGDRSKYTDRIAVQKRAFRKKRNEEQFGYGFP